MAGDDNPGGYGLEGSGIGEGWPNKFGIRPFGAPLHEALPLEITHDKYAIAGFADFGDLSEIEQQAVLNCSSHMRTIIQERMLAGIYADSKTPEVFLEAVTQTLHGFSDLYERGTVDIDTQIRAINTDRRGKWSRQDVVTNLGKEKKNLELRLEKQKLAVSQLVLHNFFGAEGKFQPDDLHLYLLEKLTDNKGGEVQASEIVTTLITGLKHDSFNHKALLYKKKGEIIAPLGSPSVQKASQILAGAKYTLKDHFALNPGVTARGLLIQIGKVADPWQIICREVLNFRAESIEQVTPSELTGLSFCSWAEFNTQVCLAYGDRDNKVLNIKSYLQHLLPFNGDKFIPNKAIFDREQEALGRLLEQDYDPDSLESLRIVTECALLGTFPLVLVDLWGGAGSMAMQEFPPQDVTTLAAIRKSAGYVLWELGCIAPGSWTESYYASAYKELVPKNILHLILGLSEKMSPTDKLSIIKAVDAVKDSLQTNPPALDVSWKNIDSFNAKSNPYLAAFNLDNITFQALGGPQLGKIKVVFQINDGKSVEMHLDRNDLKLHLKNGVAVDGYNNLYYLVLMHYEQIVSGKILGKEEQARFEAEMTLFGDNLEFADEIEALSRDKTTIRGHYRRYINEKYNLQSVRAIKHAVLVDGEYGIKLDNLNRKARLHNAQNPGAGRMPLLTYVRETATDTEEVHQLVSHLGLEQRKYIEAIQRGRTHLGEEP